MDYEAVGVSGSRVIAGGREGGREGERAPGEDHGLRRDAMDAAAWIIPDPMEHCIDGVGLSIS